MRPDPSGAATKTSAPVGKTDFHIIEESGWPVYPAKPYPLIDRINTVNARLCNGTAVQISRSRGAEVVEVGAFSGLGEELRVEVGILLSKLGDPGKRDLLRDVVELGRGMKGLIDPGEQIAINEQLLTQQGGQIGQTPAEAGAQLQVLEQEQGKEGGPDLNLQSVGAGADESFALGYLIMGVFPDCDKHCEHASTANIKTMLLKCDIVVGVSDTTTPRVSLGRNLFSLTLETGG